MPEHRPRLATIKRFDQIVAYLSDDDIAHYHKIVVALSETIRLMQEIDAVIDEHGGWLGAFAPSTSEQA
jgi:hypothetical protein